MFGKRSSKDEFAELDSYGVRALSAAVILQAYKDLVWAYRVLKRGEGNSSALAFGNAIKLKHECERFFTEDNDILGSFDGNIAIEKARKESGFKEDE